MTKHLYKFDRFSLSDQLKMSKYGLYISFALFVTLCVANLDTEVTVLNTFKEIYPQDAFVVVKGAFNWRSHFRGKSLLYVKLENKEYFHIGKLEISSGAKLNKIDVKSKAFPFVFQSKDIKNVSERCFKLRDQLTPIFPHHKLYVFVANSTWNRLSHNIKGEVTFRKQYGSDVDIILT